MAKQVITTGTMMKGIGKKDELRNRNQKKEKGKSAMN